MRAFASERPSQATLLDRRFPLGYVAAARAVPSVISSARAAGASDPSMPIRQLIPALLAARKVSQIAVQRANFRGLLASGGASALLSGLQRTLAALGGLAYARHAVPSRPMPLFVLARAAGLNGCELLRCRARPSLFLRRGAAAGT